MKRTYMTAALAALVAAGPAFAAQQSQMNQDQSTGQVQSQPQKDSEAAGKTEQATGSLNFVSQQNESDWLASSLMGRNVQNAKGEKLGDINNIVLDQNGSVVAVLIGVGGFLGLGGKDVAVEYSALEFKKREIKQPAAQNTTTGQTNPIIEKQQRKAAEEATRKDADHRDMIIVLNATYEQLESAPTYKRLGQDKIREQTESVPAEKQDKMESNQKQPQ